MTDLIDERAPQVLERQKFVLSCVVPAYNEAPQIARFLAALHAAVADLAAGFEIVVVNDGSDDATRDEVLRVACGVPLRYIELSRNFGKEAAIQAGLDVARGDCVVILDADFQHPLSLLPTLVARWRSGADVVYGVRRTREHEPLWKRLGTRLFYWLLRQRRESYAIVADAGDFRLLDRKVVAALQRLPERNRFMKGLYAWVGFRAEAVPFDVEPRSSGSSRYRLRSLLELAGTALTAFSSRPLRVVAIAGVVISFCSLLVTAWIFVEYFLLGQAIEGFTTVAAAVFFFGGAQMVAIGVLGEYVGRIFDEVKRRPLYLTSLDIDRSAAGAAGQDQLQAGVKPATPARTLANRAD